MANSTATQYPYDIISTTQFYDESTTQAPDTIDSVTTGMTIALAYGATHLILLLILAIHIYLQSRKQGDPLTIRHFFIALWAERGIYAPLLIHIYDTATDLGVIYEWYQLAQIEKEGKNLKSLDMEQFFWTAIGFMIAYRALLGLAGAGAFVVGGLQYGDRLNCEWFCDPLGKCFDKWERLAQCCCCCYIPLYIFALILYLIAFIITAALGFVFGALELLIFAGIYIDFQEKKDNSDAKPGAGVGQKICQSTEGILESLPEVIMQSVFVMRAVNDETLKKASGDIFILVLFSIFASLLSITSKYVWIDEVMVKVEAKELMIKKRESEVSDIKALELPKKTQTAQTVNKDKGAKDTKQMKLVGTCICVPSHNVSYGYIIRVVWRLAAVTARFVIFALIWVVLGGAFEIVLVPSMVLLWYIAIFFYAFCGHCSMLSTQIQSGVNKLFKSQRIPLCDDDIKQSICGINWFVDCVSIVLFCIIFGLLFGALILCLSIAGIVFQLGIAVLSGRAIYIIRVFENFLLMSIISIFTFLKFNCLYCADAHERHVLDNQRIMTWLIVGWVSVILHTCMTFLMDKVIDKDYKMDVATIVDNIQKDLEEKYKEYIKLQQRLVKLARIRAYMRRHTKEEIAIRYKDKFLPDCICGAKLVPMRRKDILISYNDSKTVIICSKCLQGIYEQEDYEIIAWHCIKDDLVQHVIKQDVNNADKKAYYDLCIDCGHTEEAGKDGNQVLRLGTMLRSPTTAFQASVIVQTDVKSLEAIIGNDKDLEIKEDEEQEPMDETALLMVSGKIELMKTNDGGTKKSEKSEEYNSDDDVLNNDEEKESEYVTPGGD
eukprot:321225_1